MRGDQAWPLPRTRRLVEPCPPLPGPLPQGEREPEVAVAVSVTMISTVLGSDRVVFNVVIVCSGRNRAWPSAPSQTYVATHFDNVGPPAAAQRLRTESSCSPGSALSLRRA